MGGGISKYKAVTQTCAVELASDLPKWAKLLPGKKKKKGFLLDGCSPENVFDVYVKQNILGEGAFAKVYKCCLKDGQGRCTPEGHLIPVMVAIKVIDKSSMSTQELPALKNEICVLKKINHSNCVRLFEYFEEKTYLYVVMDLHDGGELFDRIVKKGLFSEKEAAACTRQIARALQYLFEMRIVHRDIKPENLIYDGPEDEANLLITDFGLAQDISGSTLESPLMDACGTPGYIAPEVLKHDFYGHKADMWGMGVILYIMLCGYPPFFGEDQTKLFEKIKAGDYEFDKRYWGNVSQDAKNVVRALLTVDPNVRINATELLKERWVANPEAQSEQPLGEHVVQGITYLRKQKFNRAILKIRTIQAMGGFSAITQRMREEEVAKKAAEAAECGKEVEAEANKICSKTTTGGPVQVSEKLKNDDGNEKGDGKVYEATEEVIEREKNKIEHPKPKTEMSKQDVPSSCPG